MVLKPNWVEATSAIHPHVDPREIEMDELARVAELLGDRAGRPVFVTMSEKGVLVWADGRHELLPAMPVSPPLDPVGAGDTFISALASALAVGATPGEAGILANLAAAVTVEKLNETGSASPDEILSRYDLAQTEGVAL
jgi:sugar/nucleoside kinase (ribokinase family)